MIDTAQAYHNEEGVGNTIRKSDIDCKEIFLVSKIWISNYGYKKVKASIDKSLGHYFQNYNTFEYFFLILAEKIHFSPITIGRIPVKEVLLCTY